MKDETRVWLRYAEENQEAARLLLEQKLYNPCLKNIQPAKLRNYMKVMKYDFF